MKKPLIGVTPSLDQETKDSTCRPTYLAAIRHAVKDFSPVPHGGY